MIKARSKPSRVAHGNDHLFLPLISQAFSLLFQFCQLGCNHTRTSQQIEGCTLCVVDLPGNRGCEPQTSFGIVRTQRLPYGVLVIRPERRLIEEFDENSGFRLEDGIHTLGRHLRPLRDCFDGHSGIAGALQELPGGFNDAAPRVARLALANQ